ncbi:MAG: hypothetical protein H7123_01905 [Thermoleophilia bacterium]|nr:hypothetical protein [Thermoleophilia bacterium]
MTFKIIQQGTPLKWLCPHCEMEIEAEMLSEPDPDRAYVCFYCGWRRSLAMMEYYGFVRPGDTQTEDDRQVREMGPHA